MILGGGACRTEHGGGGNPSLPAGGVRTGPHLAVEWAGCAIVRSGPRCELGHARTLTVWIPRAGAAGLQFTTDRGPPRVTEEAAVGDGTRLVLEVPLGATDISALTSNGTAIWSLFLGAAVVYPEIDRLLAAGKNGKQEESAARLRVLVTTGPAPAQGRAEAAYGRLQLAVGNLEEAEPALRRAIDAAWVEGRLSDAVLDASALVWGLNELRQRFADARTVLARLAEAAVQYPEGKAWLAYTQGMLASVAGDVRAALSSYRNAARDAERLGLHQLASQANEDLARIFTVIGRADEAVTIFDALKPKDDPCKQATFAINRAEALMQVRAREEHAEDAKVLAAVGAARDATRRCADPHRRLVATTYATEYALQTGRAGEADLLAAQLRRQNPPGDALASSWRLGVLGRWSLARGRAREALATFDEQVAVARAAGLAEEAFRAEVGAGRALLSLRCRPQAVQRFETAQSLLEQSLEGIPLAEGRGEFLTGHGEGVRYLVSALVDGGEVAEAMRVARLSRSAELASAARLDRISRLSPAERGAWDQALERYARIRRALEQESENDWTLPRSALDRTRADRGIRADQARETLDQAYGLLARPDADRRRTFPAPSPGELELLFFPAPPGDERWLVFSRLDRQLRVLRFPSQRLDSNQAAAPLLDELSGELAAAQRVRVLAYGQSDRLDWQDVPWRGKPLITQVGVTYGVDAGSSGSDDGGRPGQALLVVNPTGDLATARVEGAIVNDALAGWRVTRLEGASASRDAILAALPGADLLHYAGHAQVFGSTGLSNAFLVAGGARIEVDDLLAVRRVPRLVVLSACETARTGATGGSSDASMMGLAEAFVLSGARTVVAATRAVKDDEARTFVASFYAGLKGLDSASVAEAYRRAVLDDSVTGNSRSFRVVVQ